jgi:uncharacterized damage-inducible protein DinB
MSPDIGQVCRGHLAYMKWADDLMLAAVAENAPDNIAVLQHVFLGEEVWLRRVLGDEAIQLRELTAPADMAGLADAWPGLHRQWLEWAASLQDWGKIIPHRNLKGDEFRMPAWQIVLHLTNHGSYHRGQVAASLRAAGFTPPSTDLIIYYRTHAG